MCWTSWWLLENDLRHCWHWCGFTSGRPPIPSLPSCIAVLVIRYCATTGISRLSSYSYREYIRLFCICVLLFLLSYFLYRPDYNRSPAFEVSRTQNSGQQASPKGEPAGLSFESGAPQMQDFLWVRGARTQFSDSVSQILDTQCHVVSLSKI